MDLQGVLEIVIRDYILGIFGENPKVEDIEQAIKSGALRVSKDEDLMYSLSEVAEIFGVDTRTVFRWGQEGKVNITQTEVGKAISSSEISRLYQTLPTPKQNTCIYVLCKDGNVDEVKAKINKLIADLKLNKYRTKVFIDIDGNTAILDLLKFILHNRCSVFTNSDLSQEVRLILKETGVKVYKF